MKDYYCGVREVPKNRRRGTMKECVEDGEIRYFGVKKVDPKMIKLAGSKKKKVTAAKMLPKVTSLDAKERRLKEDIKYEKDKKKKKELTKELDKISKERKEVRTKYNELLRKEEKERKEKSKGKKKQSRTKRKSKK